MLVYEDKNNKQCIVELVDSADVQQLKPIHTPYHITDVKYLPNRISTVACAHSQGLVIIDVHEKKVLQVVKDIAHFCMHVHPTLQYIILQESTKPFMHVLNTESGVYDSVKGVRASTWSMSEPNSIWYIF